MVTLDSLMRGQHELEQKDRGQKEWQQKMVLADDAYQFEKPKLQNIMSALFIAFQI